jgi:hypothetical protein
MRGIARNIPWARLASLAIAAGPVLMVLALASAAYSVKWTELSDQIEGRGLEIRKVGWIAANAERLSAELVAADHTLSAAESLGSGDPDAVSADLQKNLKTLLDQASLQISSIQPTAVNEEDGIRFVSVRAQASGSYDKILQFLQSTHRSSPSLLLGSLDLMPDPTQQSTGGDAAAPRYVVQFEAVRLMAAGK